MKHPQSRMSSKRWLGAMFLAFAACANAQDKPSLEAGEWGRLQLEAQKAERDGRRRAAIGVQVNALEMAERPGGDPAYAVASILALGRLHMLENQLDEAESYTKRGLAIQLPAALSKFNTGRLLHLLAQIATRRGKDDEAAGLLQQAAGNFAAERGFEETTAGILRNLGELHHKAGRFSEAEKSYLEASALLSKSAAAPPLEVALVQARLGGIYLSQRRYPESVNTLARAVSLLSRDGPNASLLAAETSFNLAIALSRQRRWQEAEPILRRVRAAFERQRSSQEMQFQAEVAHASALQGIYRFDEALRLYSNALARAEKAWGSDDALVIDALIGIADIQLQLRKFEEAAQAYQRAREIQGKLVQPRQVAPVAMGIAALHRVQGQTTQAGELYRSALAALEQNTDPRARAVALESAGLFHARQSQWPQAEELMILAVAAWESAVGKDAVELVPALDELAGAQSMRLAWTQAQATYARSLAIAERVLGPNHPVLAMRIANVAVMAMSAGAHAEGEALSVRALGILERTSEQDLTVATAQDWLAAGYRVSGQRDKAEQLLQKSLAIRAKRLPPQHALLAASHHNLALVQQEMRRFEDAERNLKEALRIRETGSQAVPAALTVLELGGLALNQCRYAEADQQFARAREVLEKNLGDKHTHVAASIEGLAVIRWSHGEFAQAESLLQQAMAIREGKFGKDASGILPSLRLAVMLQAEQGQWPAAVALELRALKIAEKAYGADNAAVAQRVGVLALLYLRQGDSVTAETLLARAVDMLEKARGKEDRQLAGLLLGVARINAKKQDLAAARRNVERAIAIIEKSSSADDTALVTALNALTSLSRQQKRFSEAEAHHRRAVAIVEKSLGRNHPLLAETLAELAAVRADDHDWTGGTAVYKRAREIWAKAEAGGGTGVLRSHLVCPKHPLEELKGDL